MDAKAKTLLPEEDYLAIIDIMGQLYQCRVKKDLKRCVENKIMPLVKAQTAGYAWASIVVWEGMVKPAQTIDMIGIPPSQWPWIEKAHPYLVSAGKLFQKTQRCVIAHDVDIPRDELKKELKRFAEAYPEFEPSKVLGFSDYVSHLVIIDRENALGVGFHRYSPNDELWTRRDIRVMELLRPSLLSAIKRVAIQEQLQTYRKLTEALAESESPCALVREDNRVLFRNPAFHAVVQVEPGSTLPKELRDLVEQQIAQLNPDHKPDTAAPPMAFYEHSEGTYRLNLTQLHPSGNEEADSAWLVRLHPAADPYTLMNLKLQKAGLTPREVEIAILLGDGLEDTDIAQRLFISPQTVKNHFKSIYKKLDVNSRTQLLARLRPSAEKMEV